jgi:hypothetical protein
VLWVQSPTGMPATHGSCIWIRRQESDLRGLRSERSWDASNPHLNDFGGPSRNRTLLTGFGDQPPPRGQPELAERGEPESHAASGTVCFPDSPRPCRVHAPKWRKAVGLDPHIREDATRFRNEGACPRTSPSNTAGGG